MSTAALQAFRDQCGNNPSSSSAAVDSEQLLGLKEEVAAKYGISTDVITEEFSKYVPWHDWARELWGGGGGGAQDLVISQRCPVLQALLL